MIQSTAVVVGAGHAGLAMSRRLTERSIDHVVLERGEVANSWRTQRWPTLRLLTPNWQTRLPGYAYAGDDADGSATPSLVEQLHGTGRMLAFDFKAGNVVANLDRQRELGLGLGLRGLELERRIAERQALEVEAAHGAAFR